MTVIHKIGIDNGMITWLAKGEVQGVYCEIPPGLVVASLGIFTILDHTSCQCLEVKL